MIANLCKLQWVSILMVFLAFNGLSSAPLEDGQFLRQISNQYSPPMVISFLHSRINFNEQMIKKIEDSLANLDKSKRDVFNLAEKTLEILDNQLIALKKADYFDFNGTDKVKYFIEQFIMVNQFYPIDFGSSGMVSVSLSIDGILEQSKTLPFDRLINQTNTLIENYLSDIEDKESNVKYNHLQNLSASLARTELQSLNDHLFTITANNPNGYSNNNFNDLRRNEVDKVLQKLKTVTDFFYSQFDHLADLQPATKIKPTTEGPRIKPIDNRPTKNVESVVYATTNQNYYDFDSEVVTGKHTTSDEK